MVLQPQELCASVAALADQSKIMIVSYQSLPAILDLEEKAIAHQDLRAIDSIGIEKQKISDAISAAFDEMNGQFLILRKHWQATLGQGNHERDLSFKHLVTMIENLCQILTLSSFELKFLNETTAILKVQLGDLDRMMADLKPKIERNKIIVQKMLKHYQESYRFWVEVADEQASNYDADGLKKSITSHFSFQVKA
jgi:hypothetical protein